MLNLARLEPKALVPRFSKSLRLDKSVFLTMTFSMCESIEKRNGGGGEERKSGCYS